MKSEPARWSAPRISLAVTCIFLLGCAIGYGLRGFVPSKQPRQHVELRQSGWEFINPLLDCEQSTYEQDNDELKPIKRIVEDFIQKQLDKKWASKVDVYFRELNDGPWFAIGRTDEFHPASLLKVPLMMSVLKQAERDPALLNKKVSLNDKELRSIPNPVPKALQFGRAYTVDELLRQMIVHSDNVATHVLANAIDLNTLSRSYSDLGLVNPYYRSADTSRVLAASEYVVSVQSYASFFRILFNASYLSKEMSEKALRLLSETDFNSGLQAGVPPGIRVAHKWGIHLSGEHREVQQLHDCGIVYFPEHPYLLCIMTSGASMEYLDDAISAVSQVIYKNVAEQHFRYH